MTNSDEIMPLGKENFNIVHLVCATDAKENFTKGHSSSCTLLATSRHPYIPRTKCEWASGPGRVIC